MKDFHNATGKWAGSGSENRALAAKLSENSVSVRDFMTADPNGSMDCLAAFNEAAEYLLSRKGGYLIVPPTTEANAYVLSSVFHPGSLTGATNNYIEIIGASGREGTGGFISGNFAGPVIANYYPNYTLRGVYGLRISNSHAYGKGIMFNRSQTAYMENCEVSASLIGIEAANETYNFKISRCSITHCKIGLFAAQVSVENSDFQVNAIGIRCCNAGFSIRNCRFENNDIAAQIGVDYQGAYLAKNNGGQMEIIAVIEGNLGTHYVTGNPRGATSGILMAGGYHTDATNSSGMLYTTGSQVSGTPGGIGIYNVTRPLRNDTPEIVIAGSGNQIAGVAISTVQTERCNSGIEIYSAVNIHVDSVVATGTIGVSRPISTTSWLGGIATVNTSGPHYYLTGKTVEIEGVSVGGYNGGPFTITVDDADTFHYTVAGPLSAGTGGTYSPQNQYGLRIRGVTHATFEGIGISAECEQAYVDLYYDGNCDQYACHMIGCTGPTISPPGNMKANWNIPTRGGAQALSLLFANLPGGADSSIGSAPILGETHTITNAATTAIGGNVTTTGSNTYLVRWNGANWIRVV